MLHYYRRTQLRNSVQNLVKTAPYTSMPIDAYMLPGTVGERKLRVLI
jgi:hypothetical protein